jgi:hypothetical protein
MRDCFSYKKVLGFFNIDGGIAFLGLFDLEGDCIAFAELIEFDSVQVVGVEEKIISAIARDKTEVFFRQLFDGSLHTNVKIKFINKY